jgi:hypothetical protein
MQRRSIARLAALLAALAPLSIEAGDAQPGLNSDCGCQSMVVNTKGASSFGDPRRNNAPAVLGSDPDFPAFGFEVEATLVPGSDPSKCEEGQQVKNDESVNGQIVGHKAKCTGGQVGKDCTALATGPLAVCDTYVCRGGTQDGKDCTAPARERACKDGGGACVSNHDGACTVYPLGAGLPRAPDDYASPSIFKIHSDETIVWFDAPGRARRASEIHGNLHYRDELDFYAFVKGNLGTCSCHFNLVIDATIAAGVMTYDPATKLMLVKDAETTANCSVR